MNQHLIYKSSCCSLFYLFSFFCSIPRFFLSVAAVTTPVTARLVNPDFLFGFDKEYSLNVTSAVHNSEITDMMTSHSGGLVDVTPVVVEMPTTRGSYVAPVVYQTVQTSSGFFQA
ncbi:hypothetical protein Hdeb2414_s0005g00163391 [Helianthus debilis subsp. tardiflorus]